MLPNTGTRLPKRPLYSDLDIADAISRALIDELGGSARAAKTVMRWADVSDRSARAWLHGQSCPSGRNLLVLAAHSRRVMTALLKLLGHDQLMVALDLQEIETELERMTERVRRLRSEMSP